MRISAQGGREVDVRACANGSAQVGIVSSHGNIMEAAVLDDPAGLIGALQSVEQERLAALEQVDRPSWFDRLDAAKQAVPRSPSHCPAGHKLTKENTYGNGDGTWGCRECRRQSHNWTTEDGRLRPKPPHGRAGKAWRFRP